MGRIYDSILELTGRTPLVELHRIEELEESQARILGKLEYFNPGGSVKDRIAVNMIEAAEQEGKLKPSGTIIEGTSGNTGIGLAMAAAAKGYKAYICMPKNMSKERIQILNGYGAEVYLTPAEKNMGGAGERAAQLLEETPGGVVIGQGGNPNNPNAHFKTTGPEIWEDTEGEVDIVVAAVGTGGTLTGLGEYLREKNPDVELVGVEPEGCPVLSGGEPGPHKIQGIGAGFVPDTLNTKIYDEVITVENDDAFAQGKEIAKEEGILVGISAGAALHAAIELAKRPENKGKNIVALLPDTGDRYYSTPLFGE